MAKIIPFPKQPIRITRIMRSSNHHRLIEEVRDGHVVSVSDLPQGLSAMWVRDESLCVLAAVHFQDMPILKLGRLRVIDERPPL